MEELFVEEGGWQTLGNCTAKDNWKLFFAPTLTPKPGKKVPPPEGKKARREREAAAKALCQDCPVRTECLELGLSLTFAERYGIWGGYSQDEMKPMRRRK